MTVFRIAQAQINPTVGDFSGNAQKIVDWIGRAKSAAADLVTFPELALCGYPPEDLLFRASFLTENRQSLEAVAPYCSGIGVLVGFADSREDRTYNAAALLYDGAIQGVYHKVELPNYGVFDEKRYFRSGSQCLVVEIAGVRVSVTVCEDIWIPGSTAERCALRNHAQVVVNLSASPFHAGKYTYRLDQIISLFARATGTTVAYTNLVGGQDELVFDGGSLVVDPHGRLLATAKRFEEDLLVTDVEIPVTDNTLPLWNVDERVRITRGADLPGRQYRPATIQPELNLVEEVYSALVLGTGDYVRKNGFSAVVIGLSGGIDSSLTAAVAVDALGPQYVTGVTMPSQYTSRETLSDAEILARNLGIELLTIPIEEVFDAYAKILEDPFRKGRTGTEFENLQARIRGNILMALSNRFGWLVLTTGNKSETAVGYCTLYGDTAGGFAVVKDVPKTLVYELSEYVNRKAGRDVIPSSVIVRPPSAELRPDQKDEDSLPPYAVLDPILKAYVEEDKGFDEIDGFPPDVVRDVIAMVDRNEYKRRQAPPGVKITPRAFGKDRRLPLTCRYCFGGMTQEKI
ncbi:MAG: NAD+ synthase [Desulfomonile tiedjei]|nr:NAD+ synthase [Desulfomonile tiedjei]